MAGTSFFQRLAGRFRRTPIAAPATPSPTASGDTIKSTPATDNPYPRRRLVPVYGGPDRGAKDLPVYSWTEWDSVTKVKAALTELESGHFLQAAQLVDAMGRDDRIAGVLATRVNGLLGLPIDFEDDKKDRARVAKALKEKRPRMLPRPQVRKLLKSGIMLGAGLAENVWTRTETEWTPRLKWWHPQFLQWRWDTRSFWVQTMEGQVEITPGDGQWVLYAPYGEQLGWLEAMVRALAVPWLVRQWARRDWSRYSEVHGIPIRKAKVPTKADNEDKERFVDEVSALGQENTIRLPQGDDPQQSFDVELLEASSKSWEGFEALIEKTDTAIAVVLLGQNLTTEISKGDGSRAAAQVHENVRQDVIESDASTLDECLHEQTIQPWATYNFGDADGAPLATFHTEPPEDLAGKATTFQNLGNALKAFKELRAPVDVGQVLVQFEVPVVEGKPMPDLTEEPEPEQTSDPNANDKSKADRAAELKALVDGLARAGEGIGKGLEARSRTLSAGKVVRNERGEITAVVIGETES